MRRFHNQNSFCLELRRYYPIGGGHQHAARESICTEKFGANWNNMYNHNYYKPLYYTEGEICIGLTDPEAQEVRDLA